MLQQGEIISDQKGATADNETAGESAKEEDPVLGEENARSGHMPT